MKYCFYIVVFLTSSLILSSYTKPSFELFSQSYIIKSGSGTDEFIIDKTKVKEIESILGKNYKISQGVVDYFGKAPKYVNHLNYMEIGVEFKFYTRTSVTPFAKSKKINAIIFRPPANATTVEGLSIGDSSSTIASVYGDQNKIHSDIDFDYFVYANKGVTFAVDTTSHLIEEIIIYSPIKQ